jgi:hypothetical protein
MCFPRVLGASLTFKNKLIKDKIATGPHDVVVNERNAVKRLVRRSQLEGVRHRFLVSRVH